MDNIEKLTINEKMALYKTNYATIVRDVVKHIRENIRNNKHNANYDIPILRKAVKREMDSRTKKDGHYITAILEYTPDKPYKFIHTDIVKSACERYGELMLQKHPHLSKPKMKSPRKFRP